MLFARCPLSNNFNLLSVNSIRRDFKIFVWGDLSGNKPALLDATKLDQCPLRIKSAHDDRSVRFPRWVG
jgi:hypothetical protein